MPRSGPKKNQLKQFETIRRELKKIVLDQNDAIDEVVDAFIHMAFRPPKEAPPKAIFTFLGPPGVGKIYLARVLCSMLNEYKGFKHFDLERYSDPESGDQLLAPQMIGQEIQEGELIRFLRATPCAIILFESIEMASNQLQMALLDLISKEEPDSGINCREVIFIFTSTLGSALYQGKEFLATFRRSKARAQSLIMDAIAKEKKVAGEIIQDAIAPKLLATLAQNYIVLFNRLGINAMVRIGTDSMLQLGKHFHKKGIDLEFPDLNGLVALLVLSLGPAITAKKVKQKLPDEVLFKITRSLRQLSTSPARIIFKLTKKAEASLHKLSEAGDQLLPMIYKNNQTVELTWKEYQRAESLIFSLVKAETRALPMGKGLLRSERPAIEFSDIGFESIAGNRQTKTTLKQIINTLKNPELVKKFSISMPKGMLLHGPPGVGKTLLSKAFARETGRPYIYVSRTELFDSEYIRLVYLKAREYAPSIVFLDGIDIKGLMEGMLTGVPSDQIALEIDALSDDPEESVFTVITAMSREEVPPLLIEPERIDTFVEVPELDREARRFFIEQILKKPNDGKIDVDKVVRYISGMNGYELQRIGKEASLHAIRHGLDCISEEILIEQINIIKYGSKLEKRHIRNLEEDLRMTAFHEAGHAVLSFLLLPDVKIEQVTIAPRLRTLGFISYSFEDFPSNLSKEEVFNNISVLMAGRIAGMKKFGPKGMDTGATSDLEAATHQAYTAIASLGMDEELGFVHADTLSRNVNKEMFREVVERQVRLWIDKATRKAGELVETNWPEIETLANILIRQEIVDGGELEKIMQKKRGAK
ncbi:MAG: AAA family ATPase [Desulfobulbaceae bacterium]|nr:AAA family ATPase [Desulfobulbaceae bacterium]HIJ90438.1 AAA family ATPase [Deltaproteobacteria bacterium]